MTDSMGAQAGSVHEEKRRGGGRWRRGKRTGEDHKAEDDMRSKGLEMWNRDQLGALERGLGSFCLIPSLRRLDW